MPVYEYQCQSCHHRFEAKQRITEPPLTTCIRCGQAVSKLISSPAIMFKGTGWYVTDYSDKLKPTDKGEGQKEGSEKPREGGSETGKAAGASGSGPTAPAAASAAPSSSSTTPAKSTSS